MFIDRTDAGIQLGKALLQYKGPDTIVLAIPRGGAEVGYQVAKTLDAPLSLIIARKLPLPWSPEAGFGAVAEDGSIWLVPGFRSYLMPDTVEEIIAGQTAEVRRRIDMLRAGLELPDIKGRTVILVDDGIAMGSTMRASVQYCRNQEAGKVVVAAPVTGRDTAGEMKGIADDVVILKLPPSFRAVAQVYRKWYDVPDEEVLEIMEKAGKGMGDRE
jgi:predicted phosphoribosyltransferase